LDTDQELPSIKFSLFHKGSFSVSETPLGYISIPLHDIDPKGREATDLWYPLKKIGRMSEVSGEVICNKNFSLNK
jgi:hypothetical protein